MTVTDLRVCFLGDSFVAGVGDPEHLGWVGRLAAATHRAGVPLTAYNLGVRRQTSGDVLLRWRSECQQRLPDGCDNRIVVSFGANDTASESGTTRVTAAASVDNLTALLRGARTSGWQTLVVGPPPVADPVHNDRTAILDKAFSATCIAADVPYVAILAPLLATPVWMTEVRAGDGSHPGAAGYDALHQLVRPTWSDWISC